MRTGAGKPDHALTPSRPPLAINSSHEARAHEAGAGERGGADACGTQEVHDHANGEKEEDEIARDIDERTKKHRYLPKTWMYAQTSCHFNACLRRAR